MWQMFRSLTPVTTPSPRQRLLAINNIGGRSRSSDAVFREIRQKVFAPRQPEAS
jgi:hypothetical protein